MRILRKRAIYAKLLVTVLDALIVSLSYALSLWVRFDFRLSLIPVQYKVLWLEYLPYQITITVGVFAALRMYRFIWHTVGLRDILAMMGSTLAAYAACNAILLPFGWRMPISVSFVALVLQMLLFVGMRCSVRIATEMLRYLNNSVRTESKRILLVGGGSAGRAIIQEIACSPRGEGRVCCVVDDNPIKHGKRLYGVPIIGGRELIAETVKRERINQIIMAIPSAAGENRRELLRLCGETGVPTKALPSIMQLVNGQARVSDLKTVQIEDLLGRDSIHLTLHSLRGFLTGRCVMVTGGGGSIGSELCRQIARYQPAALIIVDIYENNAYTIEQELRRAYGISLNLHVEIASVRDRKRLEEVFSCYHPELVFHAAAHKHVPLMENCPMEAIKNNIFGTYHLICTAEKFQVKKFVMISTDKAVNPSNVMGATKRFCEMIVQSRIDSKMESCSVRFGNVLGSNGSVVPLFRTQIREGGPVTVTDKRITRFFMTIPEAVQLVLEAGTMGKRGQIFVLDMGEPVRILDLAEKMIRLSGLEPYRDIDIQEIGLRPGEKLYEELLMASNDLSSTENKKIFVEQQCQISREEIERDLDRLHAALDSQLPSQDLIVLLKELVPTYHSPEEINSGKRSYQAPELAPVRPV